MASEPWKAVAAGDQDEADRLGDQARALASDVAAPPGAWTSGKDATDSDRLQVPTDVVPQLGRHDL